MIALDTTVLVRFLVRDDKGQARKARSLVDSLTEHDDRAYVSDIVLCELVWVLGRTYRLGRTEIADTLATVVHSKQLQFSSIDQIVRALSAFERGSGDFADYLIREHARAAGCDTILTFDRDLFADESFASP